MLSTYVALVERNLNALVEDELRKIWSTLDENNEILAEVALDLQHQLESGVTTRLLTAAGFIATWALYETAVTKFAEMIQHRKNVSLRLNDLRGQFLKRARHYFDDVLRYELHPVSTDWQLIGKLALLRNVLAHTNGVLRDVKPKEQSVLEDWAKTRRDLVIVGGALVLSTTFVKESLKFFESLLYELMDRMRADGF